MTWSADAGHIDASGAFTAPATAGTYHVTAVSNADPGAKAGATVTVSSTPIITITIDPAVVNLAPGRQQQFHAIVSGSGDRDVLWSVAEATGGSIDGQGLYTAPLVAGTYHVAARSHADPTRVAQAVVSVTETPQVTISITPGIAAVQAGATFQFTAAVTGSADTSVVWSSDIGTVDQTGVFTAPGKAGTGHVIATSHADPTKSQSATVTVLATTKVAVSIDPSSASILLGQTQQLNANVVGATDTRVIWTSDSGAVTPAGLYTPSAVGTWHVTATSIADPAASATATIVVAQSSIAVSISPASVTVPAGATVHFTASVTGTTDTRVHFAVCCNVAATVSDDGTVLAPQADGVYHVSAQSLADPNRTATATLTVKSDHVSVRVDPATITVEPGGNRSFTAVVNGTSNTAVTWSVDGGAANGLIDQTGVYTAPPTPGSYTVRATSVVDPSQSGTSLVDVKYALLVDLGGAVAPAVRVFAVFWGDATQFPPGERATIEAFFRNVSGSSYAGVLDQYLRGAKATITFAGSLDDPSAPGVAAETESCAALDKAGITPASGDMVFVYTSNVPNGGFLYECANHSWTTCKGVTVLTSFMPNLGASINCHAVEQGCNARSEPANTAASVTAHELFEAITDPFGNTWRDLSSRYTEIGDKCAWNDTCVTLGSETFQLQRMWSNAAKACVP